MSGYLYRIFPADAARLRAVAAELISPPCWTFGGAALWDFDASKGRANLRPVTPLPGADAIAALEIAGDFGHLFGAEAELRWKRYDETTYDLLVLSEQELTLAGASVLAAGWETSAQVGEGLLQTDDQPALSYIAYHAPDGAVQFLRYTGVQA